MKSSKLVRGFTLVELLVVIAIIAIVSAIAAPYYAAQEAKANSQHKYQAAQQLVNSWMAVAQSMTVSRDPLNSNLFTAAAHDARDILIPLDGSVAVATAFRNRFIQNRPVGSLQQQFITITEPTAAATGVYAIGDDSNRVTLAYNTTTRVVSVIIQNVNTDEVRELMNQYYPCTSTCADTTNNSNYVAATARTTSNIQYTAAAADGSHTLTILRRI